MNLRDWLYQYGVNIKEFADALDVDRTYIHRIMKGVRSPSDALLEKIGELTNNQVVYRADLKDVQKPVKKLELKKPSAKKRKATSSL